jgi:hypothetical protein
MICPFKLTISNIAPQLGRGFTLAGLGLAWVINGLAQTIPDFAFPQPALDSITYETKADQQVRNYRLPLSPMKRKNLLRELLDSPINWMDYFYLAQLLEIPIELDEKQTILRRLQVEKDSFNLLRLQDFLTNKTQKSLDYKVGNELSEKFYPVFDFNQDGKPEMLIFPEGYFGPSYGYKIYARRGDKFQYIFDNSGNFSEVKAGKTQTILRFKVSLMEASETQISQTIVFDHLRNQCTTQPKLYYATQTQLPKQLSLPILVQLRQSTELRASPQINDHSLDTTQITFDTLTRVLRGNVVAEYRAGDQAYQLATLGEWVLVAFLPKNPPIRSSLHHGLDNGYYDDKGNWLQKTRIQAYLVGWVKKKAFI